MITEAQSLLLMMHGRKTACIFHNAYFDIGLMICSAALSPPASSACCQSNAPPCHFTPWLMYQPTHDELSENYY